MKIYFRKILANFWQLFCFGVCLFAPNKSFAWGFYVHRYINRHAVFTLPPDLFQFYKHYMGYLVEHSGDPDKRRGFDKTEADKHFINLDLYVKNPTCSNEEILAIFLHDDERQYGILPLNIAKVKYDLTYAFKTLNLYKILKLSSDLGHYVGDLHVPLHTTSNYDGQEDGQEGIHALWESRIPELFFCDDSIKFFSQKAEYINDPFTYAWEKVLESHRLVEEVLKMEKATAKNVRFGTHCFEKRKSYYRKIYSKAYAKEFYRQLQGQVEQQLLGAVKMLGDLLYTCWLDAGSPDLSIFTERH